MADFIKLGAINKYNNKYTRPSDANKNDNFLCIECAKDVIIKKGNIRIHHFAHSKEDSKCNFYNKPNETEIHKTAKLILKYIIENNISLTIYNKCTYCNYKNEYIIPQLKENYSIHIEYRFEYNGIKIADIAYTKNNEILYIFEICNTHRTLTENRPEPWFELDARELIDSFNNSELQKIYLHCIRNKNCQNCIYQKQNLYIYKNIFTNTLSDHNFYKKIFDECYKKERFELYEYWISVGMAIKNTFINDDEAFDLFNYYSSKGSNYEGIEKTKYKYMSFIQKNQNTGYTIATIHFYAIEDNKSKFIEIMSKNTFELGQTDICKYLKIIGGHKFIYIIEGENYKLYCYNGQFWEKNDIILRNYLSNEIYNFLKMILTEVYWDNKQFSLFKNKIEKLKSISYKKEIIESYKEYGVNNDIQFDNKWFLFGFNNIVYDLQTEEFREYKYDDYISTTCGYDWRNPTQDEIDKVNQLIISIMPIEDERNTFLQILSTALEGRCLEKFIIFNGSGGNGKGLINDLLLNMLGDHGMIANNSILFENNKTGSNPEKANIHKKRYVVFREPPEKNKFENSVIKELTGGGTFSSRTLYEKSCNKELNLTMVVECNQKPLFSEEPKESETRRIIDIYFRSTFVTNDSSLDPTHYIYKANIEYKTKEFQDKHKFALFKILSNVHKTYKNNNYIINISPSIQSRTESYLELSCNILQWFKDNYILSDDKKVYTQIKDVYDHFYNSTYMANLSKQNKNKYNKKYFNDYFQSNVFFKKYYFERYDNYRHVIRFWRIKNDQENNSDEFI
jgi:phage/plasmid-associated DNA primase